MKKNMSTVMWKVFLAIYAVLLIAVVVLCAMKTQENIPANLMTWYPFAGILLITILSFLGIKIEEKNENEIREWCDELGIPVEKMKCTEYGLISK